jgi:molecular chaperone GrpE
MTKKKPTGPEPDWDDALQSLVDQLHQADQRTDPSAPEDPAPGSPPPAAPASAEAPADPASAEATAEQAPAEVPLEPAPPTPEQLLAERTADLQRLQAEYVNYKKRVDRDRDRARQIGIEAVLGDLLPVLDGIEAARSHDELNGGAKLLADELAKVTVKYGLEPYGQVGDPFDPHIHEALMNLEQPGYSVTSVAQVFQLGYRLAGRVLRPARVAVADPTEPEPAAGAGAEAADSAASPSSAATLNSPASPASPDSAGPAA